MVARRFVGDDFQSLFFCKAGFNIGSAIKNKISFTRRASVPNNIVTQIPKLALAQTDMTRNGKFCVRMRNERIGLNPLVFGIEPPSEQEKAC